MDRIELILVVLACLTTYYGVQSAGVSCYECNVFQGGNGQQCPEDVKERQRYENPTAYDASAPLDFSRTIVRHNCTACLKVYTYMQTHHHKDEFEVSEVVSRICAGREVEFLDLDLDDCETTDASGGGISERCFCRDSRYRNPGDKYICNGAAKQVTMVSILVTAVSFLKLFL